MQPQPTERELQVLAAWSQMGSVVGAARLLNIREQTAKNVLHTLRIRSRASSNVELFRMHWRVLPTISGPAASHNP